MKQFITADGSYTLISDQFGEAYHSRHGAITESQHVFIEAGLKYILPDYDHIHVLELGLGTGLNALLTLAVSIEERKPVFYTAYEEFPISTEQAGILNYTSLINQEVLQPEFMKIHTTEWNKEVSLSPFFTLEKKKKDFNTIDDTEKYDLIYMDAFAPNAQPEFWEEEFIQKLCASLKSGGILVTYCAKGSFKRALKASNMKVEGIPGPPGKREMTRATKT